MNSRFAPAYRSFSGTGPLKYIQDGIAEVNSALPGIPAGATGATGAAGAPGRCRYGHAGTDPMRRGAVSRCVMSPVWRAAACHGEPRRWGRCGPVFLIEYLHYREY